MTIWAGKPTQHAVALTFDDGPSPVYTGEILDLLHQYQAKATFFVLGEKVEQYPEIVKAMIRGGHEVGNHTFDHVRLTKASQRVREQELERTELDLELLGAPRSGLLVRPPYSDFDKRLVSYLKHNHQELVLWSVDSGDWQGLDTPAIVRNVLDRVKNGSIVIFHERRGRRQRPPAHGGGLEGHPAGPEGPGVPDGDHLRAYGQATTYPLKCPFNPPEEPFFLPSPFRPACFTIEI